MARLTWLIAIWGVLCVGASPAIAAKYCAQFKSTLTPDFAVTDQVFDADVKVRNCGSLVWEQIDPNRVFLVQHWYQNNQIVKWNAARTAMPGPVKSWQTIDIKAKVKAPSTGGSFELRWDLVHVDTTNVEHYFSKAGNQMAKDAIFVMKPVVGKVIEAVKPKINGIYFNDVKPGQQGLIFGSWFGDAIGKVELTLPSKKIIPLSVIKWTPLVIHFKTPAITGERDGAGTIRVRSAQALTSAGYNLPFKATRELKRIGDILKVEICADPLLSLDHCDVDTFVDIFGKHQTWCCLLGDDGTDFYGMTTLLKNGWVIDKHVENWWVYYKPKYYLNGINCLGNNCPYVSIRRKDNKWGNWIGFEVEWDTGLSPNGVLYYIDVYAKGPKGVPYK